MVVLHASVLQEKKTEDLQRLVKILAADAYRTAHETHRAMVKQVASLMTRALRKSPTACSLQISIVQQVDA